MAGSMNPYLLRCEQSCGILYDKTARRMKYIPLDEAREWARRTDVDVLDYSGMAPPDSRPHFAAPLLLFMDITADCQCACWYCYNTPTHTGVKAMEREFALRIIARFAKLGGIELRLAGGEPTLYPHLIELLSHADSFALRTILVSNGLVNAPVLDKLVNAPVTAYYLSLQGDEATHDACRGTGTYHQCLRTARTLIETGVRVRLSMVFHKRNIHCVSHVTRLAAEIGADVAFNPLRPFGRATPAEMLSTEEHRSLVETVVSLRSQFSRIRIDTPWDFLLSNPSRPTVAPAYQRIGCGNSGITVTVTGDCFSCGQLCGQPEFRLGSLHCEDLQSIWLRSRRQCPLVRAELSPRCRICPYLINSPCFGGCAATAMAVRGSMTAGDPYCFAQWMEEPRDSH